MIIGQVQAAFKVLNDNIEYQKSFIPPGLSSGEHIGCLEVFDHVVLALNSNHVIGALKPVILLFLYFHNG